MEDKNFCSECLNNRVYVLGANDGIISLQEWLSVASSDLTFGSSWISASSAIFAGAFSMAGMNMSGVSTQKIPKKLPSLRNKLSRSLT